MSFCQEDFNCHIDFLRYVGMQDWLEVGKMAKKIYLLPRMRKGSFAEHDHHEDPSVPALSVMWSNFRRCGGARKCGP